MKIGILQTGRAPEALRATHGDYDAMFRRLLAGHGFTFETWPVLDGSLPDDVHAADGWLITGSKFAVYEDHPWIPPLEAFLRAAYAAAVPIVGICFGHQILAQALGGRVEKFPGGWSVGPVAYHSAEGAPPEQLMAWHQDQVITPPAMATTVASTEFCRHAMLRYGDRAFSLQPHPEFTAAFLADLLAARGDGLPAGLAATARAQLSLPTTSAAMAARIAAFFTAPRDEREPHAADDPAGSPAP